jgi:uncharacterized protein YbjT (DUF2867 family)
MYVVLGATGHIGSRIADALLDQGEQVRVIGRDIKNLKSLLKRGAVPSTGDLTDEKFLGRSFTGASAVFSMIPPNIKAENFRSYQNKISESIIHALKDSQITHVINLSSIGADLSEKNGPIAGLHDFEEKLNKLGFVNVLHLRAAYFMENLLGNIEMIKTGINGSAIKGDLRMPMIATKDIADAAVRHLTSRNFEGKSVKYLLGQRDLTMIEVSSILGKAIGKNDLRYVKFSYDDALKAMVDMGLSKDVAGSYVEMSRAFNDGWIKTVERTRENSTKTSIEDFSVEFRRIYCLNNPECKVG